MRLPGCSPSRWLDENRVNLDRPELAENWHQAAPRGWPSYADDGDRCQVRKFVHYRVDATSSGELHMVLEAGLDDLALVGR